jgi:thiol-disulfide isomerase/thioredoxin
VAAQFTMPPLSHSLTRLDPPVPAKDFTLKDMDGKSHALADYRGKVVLINFWATWCPPCRREMPSMEHLYQKLRDKPFVVLAINQWEDPDQVFAYLGQLGTFPTFPILFDPKSEVAQAFGVKGLPTSFLLDKEGRVVYRAIGGREFDHPEVEHTVEGLLR